MDRRTMLLSSIAAATMAATGSAFAGEHKHEHHAAEPLKLTLIEATSDCIKRGQACISHCFILLGQGEKEMAACAASVHQMLAVCAALQQLASSQSPFLAAQAKVAMEACLACETECKKHADKHAECKACAEACAVCYRECKKVAA